MTAKPTPVYETEQTGPPEGLLFLLPSSCVFVCVRAVASVRVACVLQRWGKECELWRQSTSALLGSGVGNGVCPPASTIDASQKQSGPVWRCSPCGCCALFGPVFLNSQPHVHCCVRTARTISAAGPTAQHRHSPAWGCLPCKRIRRVGGQDPGRNKHPLWVLPNNRSPRCMGGPTTPAIECPTSPLP